MKVYIVTAGRYSDYHVEAVFTDPEKAKMYANLDSERTVEEYEADSVDMEYKYGPGRPNAYSVYYDFKEDKIISLSLTYINDHSCDEIRLDLFYPTFHLYVCDSEPLFNEILKDGRSSSRLKKIAQDRFAEYLYEHGIVRAELLDRIAEIRETHKQQHEATTSAPPDPEKLAWDTARRQVTEMLKKTVTDGKPLPESDALTSLLNKAYDDAKPQYFTIKDGKIQED